MTLQTVDVIGKGQKYAEFRNCILDAKSFGPNLTARSKVLARFNHIVLEQVDWPLIRSLHYGGLIRLCTKISFTKKSYEKVPWRSTAMKFHSWRYWSPLVLAEPQPSVSGAPRFRFDEFWFVQQTNVSGLCKVVFGKCQSERKNKLLQSITS